MNIMSKAQKKNQRKNIWLSLGHIKLIFAIVQSFYANERGLHQKFFNIFIICWDGSMNGFRKEKVIIVWPFCDLAFLSGNTNIEKHNVHQCTVKDTVQHVSHVIVFESISFWPGKTCAVCFLPQIRPSSLYFNILLWLEIWMETCAVAFLSWGICALCDVG